MAEAKAGSAAENTETPQEKLAELSKDQSEVVRRAVAKSESIPIVLSQLAEGINHTEFSNSENPRLREFAAGLSKLPLEDLEKLVRDEEWSVRAAAAVNVNATMDMLETLAADSNTFVRGQVIGSLRWRDSIHPWDKALLKGIAASIEGGLPSQHLNMVWSALLSEVRN